MITEMYPNETAEHQRDHRCRNKEVNQFCYDPISKYRGKFCGCITRHHPVWAGSRSWVSRHLSLHLSIRRDEVRVRSCLVFRYRIWPNKANLRDLIAATGLIILLKLDSNRRFFSREMPNLAQNRRFFLAVWPWNLTDDLQKQKGTSSMLLQALCSIS